MKIEKGDWLYFEFDLFQCKDVREGYVDISNGCIETGIRNDGRWDVFPMTMRTRVISDEFKYWSKELHAIRLNLNFPDIHRALVSMWTDAVREKDDKKLCEHYDAVQKFAKDIQSRCQELKAEEVGGVRLFR